MVDWIILTAFGATVVPLIAVIALLGYMLRRAQRELVAHQEAMLALFKSKSTSEYAASKEALETSPEDRLRQMELENDLATKAAGLVPDRQSWAQPT